MTTCNFLSTFLYLRVTNIFIFFPCCSNLKKVMLYLILKTKGTYIMSLSVQDHTLKLVSLVVVALFVLERYPAIEQASQQLHQQNDLIPKTYIDVLHQQMPSQVSNDTTRQQYVLLKNICTCGAPIFLNKAPRRIGT